MIYIKKNLEPVPSSLNTQKVQKAFRVLVNAKSYDKRYDPYYRKNDVKVALQSLYHNKCAFCEDKLLNNVKHIEHFRPKQNYPKTLAKCNAGFGYYWLAFSWENLLWVCGECNQRKSCCFDIVGNRKYYDNEPFQTLHHHGQQYLQHENPMFFNPEQEDPEPHLFFDEQGQISSAHPRLSYTIRICELNRRELVQKRFYILSDFKKELKQGYEELYSPKNHLGIEDRFDYFKTSVETFLKNTTKEEAFFAWRTFILRNYERFLCSEKNEYYNKVIRVAIKKYGESNPNYASLFKPSVGQSLNLP